MLTVATQQIWTYERMLAELPTESRYELIDNELLMPPSPIDIHQGASHEFDYSLTSYVKQKKIGKVYTAPFDVILNKNNVVEPDILFISTEKLEMVRGHVNGVPDLVVEVVSPSSVYRDYYVKKNLYERFGVKEYWILDPANRVIEVFKLVEEKYELHYEVAEKGMATSALLTEFQVNIDDIFQK